MGLAELLSEVEADPAFDLGTWRRGAAYAREGRVSQLEHEWADGRLSVRGRVFGTGFYWTSLEVVALPAGRVQVQTSCTCPMGYDCKHAVALVVTLREQLPARPPDWRTVLDEVLDEAGRAREDAAQATEPSAVLGIELVLPKPRAASRWGPSQDLLRVGVRAVRRGRTGRWVRRGMEWNRIGFDPYADEWSRDRPSLVPGGDPEDLDALAALKIALLGRRAYLSTVAEGIDLHGAGAGVWRALDRVVERGVALVCSDPAVEVAVLDTVASIEIDVRDRNGMVGLRPGVRAAGQRYEIEEAAFVGEPPHGVVLRIRREDESLAGLVLARLDRPVPPSVRTWLVQAPELNVDRTALDELVGDYLPALAEAVPVVSRDGSVAIPGPAQVSLRGDLTWGDEGEVELVWRWLYRRDDPAGQGQKAQQFPLDGPASEQGARGWRDRSAEAALVERLRWDDDLDVLLGLRLRGPGTLSARIRLRDVEAMRFAQDHLPRLEVHPDLEIVTNGEPPGFREVTGVPEVRFAPRGAAERKDKTDWLDLEVVVSVDDAAHGTVFLGLATVIEALATQNTVVMLRKGVYVDLDRPDLDKLARLVAEARTYADHRPSSRRRRDEADDSDDDLDGDSIRLSREAHGLLADVHEIGATEGQLTEWAAASRALRDLAESAEPLPQLPLPTGLRATLRPYQHDGYQWLGFLRRHGLGGVLADDMGLGKTVQTLAMIARAREESTGSAGGHARTPFLVVVPASVVSTWVSEAARFTPHLRVVTVPASVARRGWPLSTVVGGDDPADVVVTTYTLLRLEADDYAAVRWAGLILDEAQAAKNYRSKTWAALRDVQADCRFAITGTPLENNLMELWALLSLTAPGLFPYAELFRTTIAQPVEQHADPDALPMLLRRIKPVLLRRTKELVAADLPPKQVQIVDVELSPEHRTLYDTYLARERQRVLKLLEDLDENRITILASLTRLRQLSLDPALVDPVHERVGSAKIDELLDRLDEVAAEGHRALVFSQFTGFLARVRKRLDEAGIGYSYLDGRTRKRAEVVDGFRNGDVPVFLISLKAGGVGLNLTEADYVFVLDPWWNPAVEAQAIDRTHRIGQTRPVLVYRLVAADTVEEKVVALSARKAELFASVLDGEGGFSAALTAEDIAGLLG